MQELGDVPGEEVAGRRTSGVTLYRGGRYMRVETDDDFGPRVVESFDPRGVSYTAYADEAVAAVDRGDAAAAFLLAAGDRRAGVALRARAARRCRRSRRSSTRS